MKKNIILLVAFALFIFGCKKDDHLFPIAVNDSYVMKPGGNDVIKNRVYDIYQKYGVSVFFSDTIGTYLVKNDIHGNPVYRTETLDFGWTFTAYNFSKYKITQIEGIEEQQEALNYVESYFNSISKPLYPFSILVAREFEITSQTGEVVSFKNGAARNFFRTLMMTDKLLKPDTLAHFKSIVNDILRVKIENFPDEITNFCVVSKGSWYGGVKFSNLDPTIPAGTSVGILNVPALVLNLQIRGFSDEYIANFQTEMRAVCGRFGFVCGNPISSGAFTPSGFSDDLDGFIAEMVKTDKATFEKYWGKYPLVMKKYQILHDLILTKLGVDL